MQEIIRYLSIFALYTAGGVDAQVAFAEAEALLKSDKPSQLTVAALWYLKCVNLRDRHYNVLEHLDGFVPRLEEPAFRAFIVRELSSTDLLDELIKARKAPELSESQRKALEEVHRMILDWLPTLKKGEQSDPSRFRVVPHSFLARHRLQCIIYNVLVPPYARSAG